MLIYVSWAGEWPAHNLNYFVLRKNSTHYAFIFELEANGIKGIV